MTRNRPSQILPAWMYLCSTELCCNLGPLPALNFLLRLRQQVAVALKIVSCWERGMGNDPHLPLRLAQILEQMHIS